MSLFVVGLDITIVDVALPTIPRLPVAIAGDELEARRGILGKVRHAGGMDVLVARQGRR